MIHFAIMGKSLGAEFSQCFITSMMLTNTLLKCHIVTGTTHVPIYGPSSEFSGTTYVPKVRHIFKYVAESEPISLLSGLTSNSELGLLIKKKSNCDTLHRRMSCFMQEFEHNFIHM